MKPAFKHHLFCFLCFWLLLSGAASAQEVVAVLSSDLGPYVEAFKGFQEALGFEVPRKNINEPEAEPQTKVVVAFGGKAALKNYPSRVRVVYCLAPGVLLGNTENANRFTRVPMLPQPGFVIQKLLKIQPNLKRLVVFWASDAMADYNSELARVARSLGVAVLDERVEGPEDLPERLRTSLRQGADAIWMPPDPALINARSFAVLKAFSQSNDIPFYVPTAGLAEKGAVASISSSFREVGRTAGEVVKQILKNDLKTQVVYPTRVETTVNLTAAARAGLTINRATLSGEDRVLP